MPAIGEKVYVRKDGQDWKGDISHVAADGTVSVNLHGSMHPHPVTGALVEIPDIADDGHAMNIGGVSGCKLAASKADQGTDGMYWLRKGRFFVNTAGRREWQGGE